MVNLIPNRVECLEILRNSGCEENVIAHCIAVEELAMTIAARTDASGPLVRAGALLHDIGRSKAHGVSHAVEGARIARELGLDERIVHMIERHIGAGITEEEARKIGLPPGEYIPQTLEEKIVAHSDNLVENNEKVSVEQVIQRFQKAGYEDAAKKILALDRELSTLCGIDLDLL